MHCDESFMAYFCYVHKVRRVNFYAHNNPLNSTEQTRKLQSGERGVSTEEQAGENFTSPNYKHTILNPEPLNMP